MKRRHVPPPVAMAARIHAAARGNAWVTRAAPTTPLRVFVAAFSSDFGGAPAAISTAPRTIAMAARVHAAAFAKAPRYQRAFAAAFSGDFA